MSITTKTGDDGKSRWNNKVVDKDSELLESVGTLDELQAVLGIIKSKVKSLKSKEKIEEIEKDLWAIMGEISCDLRSIKYDLRIRQIEAEIINIEKDLPKMQKFVVPGENEIEALLNWARTVCRRAERNLVKYGKVNRDLDKNILIYINRLSDYLFILSLKVGQV